MHARSCVELRLNTVWPLLDTVASWLLHRYGAALLAALETGRVLHELPAHVRGGNSWCGQPPFTLECHFARWSDCRFDTALLVNRTRIGAPRHGHTWGVLGLARHHATPWLYVRLSDVRNLLSPRYYAEERGSFAHVRRARFSHSDTRTHHYICVQLGSSLTLSCALCLLQVRAAAAAAGLPAHEVGFPTASVHSHGCTVPAFPTLHLCIVLVAQLSLLRRAPPCACC